MPNSKLYDQVGASGHLTNKRFLKNVGVTLIGIFIVLSVMWSPNEWLIRSSEANIQTPEVQRDQGDHLRYFREVACRDDKTKMVWINQLLEKAKTLTLTKAEIYSILLFPMQSICDNRLTIGGSKRKIHSNIGYDGQKMICVDAFTSGSNCLIYSFGIGGDVSFEHAVSHFGCEVLGYDHTIGKGNITRFQDLDNNFRIFDKGIGVRVEPDKKLTTLEHEFQTYGHTNRPITVLKADVEGIEFALIKDWIAKGLLKNVRQMVVEFHKMDTLKFTQVLKGLFEEGFYVVGFETNWFGGLSNNRPTLFEVHFAKGQLNC